jgi:phosphate:Na+ symporter
MNSTGITAWAGLGLFFIGMRVLSAHVRQLGGSRFHAVLVRALGRPIAPQMVGLMFGAVTQSTGAATFVTSGLVASGALSMARALPMLAWANLGTSALVLLAAVNIQSMVLILLGLVGLWFFLGLDQSDRFRHLVFGLLGLGLLLLGLTMLKGSVAALASNHWMQEFVQFSGSGVAIALVSGFVIAVAVQSSSIVTVLALPLVQQGLLSLDQTVLLVYGASVGSGFSVLLLASGMEGPSRQLSLCQAVLRTLTAVLLMPLYFIERDAGVPLVMGLLRTVSDSPATQCAIAYLLFQLILVMTSWVSASGLLRLSERLAPPSLQEALVKPRFLIEEAIGDPVSALALVKLEHGHLVRLLPDFLDELRPLEERSAQSVPLRLRALASESIADEIDRFLSATVRATPDMNDIEEVFAARSRLQMLVPLQSALNEFATELLAVPEAQRPVFAANMVEGLHAVLSVAADTADDDSELAAELLFSLTGERSALMERVRSELLGGSSSMEGRESLLSATLVFERIIWLLRRLASPRGDGALSKRPA